MVTAVLTAGVEWNAPCSAAARSAHSACTSSMNGREPCTVTVGAEDTSAVRMRSPMNRALGEGTGHSPSSRISNTPTSSTEPYRFLCPRSTRTARSASPSMYSTTSTMCSSTRGPAMSPLLVTCPMMNTGMPAVFAACSSAVAHSRTCDVDPGEPVASSRNTVWIESTTSAAGRSRTTAAKIASSRVAEYTITPSAWTPKRSAREASCSTLSSPDAYKTLAPAPGPAPSPAASVPAPSPPAKKTPPRARAPPSRPATCSASVLLPTPGSPPMSSIAPGATPPPSTRSTSAPSAPGSPTRGRRCAAAGLGRARPTAAAARRAS